MPARLFRRPTRTITETVHGVPVEYTVPDNTPVIRLPFNLDAMLRRTLFTLAVTMTIVAIIWGTVAIGSMLAMLAPAWAAYLVAGVFDAGWAACLIAEWVLRYDSTRANLPARAGIAMLVVSMAAIITHGALTGPWGWIIGIVGALVSAAAKGVWAIGMHTIRIRLEPKYEAYLNAQRQQAGTEMALALGERDRLITRDRTVKVRLALEARRTEPTVDQITDRPQFTPDQPTVQPSDQLVNQAEPATEPAAVHAAQTTVNRPAHTGQVEDQVTELLRRLKVGERITKSQAAKILGVPESTAYRRLRDAQALLNQYN
jgi:O6-methylguanine-DNA--protein-cysteine methyltransferase